MPSSLEEACQLLSSDPKNHVALGGCCWLRLGNRRIRKAVDLSRLGLDYIREEKGWLVLGASVPLRQLEIHPAVTRRFDGLLGRAVSSIVGPAGPGRPGGVPSGGGDVPGGVFGLGRLPRRCACGDSYPGRRPAGGL